MLRKITKDAGRYRAGEMHDYPRGVWTKLATDLLRADGKRTVKPRDVEAKLASFSEPVEFNASHQNVTRGPHRQRARLGAEVTS